MINGALLKGLRKERKLSLQALSDQTGISRAFLSKLELGEKEGSIHTLTTLATFFGCTIDFLLEVPDEDFETNSSKLYRKIITLDKDEFQQVERFVDYLMKSRYVEFNENT